MINYDFYDMYAVIVGVRCSPENKRFIPVLNGIAEIIDKSRNQNGADFNTIRKVIKNCHGTDIYGLEWAETENIYTANIIIMKNEVHYKILSGIFHELSLAVEDDKERACLAADCFHNIPTLLADSTKPKKVIEKSMKRYREKYHSEFLKNELKLLYNKDNKI